MAKVREMTEADWQNRFRKLMGKDPTVGELQQFRKNYLNPFSYEDERKIVPEGEADDDHPFLSDSSRPLQSS